MSREEAILDLIVEAAVEERPVSSLINAYIDERLHDEDVPGFESTRELQQWMRETLDMLYGRDEIGRALRSGHSRSYKRIAPWSRSEEVFVLPEDMPDTDVPREVAVAVGEALGRRDGLEAKALKAAYVRAK